MTTVLDREYTRTLKVIRSIALVYTEHDHDAFARVKTLCEHYYISATNGETRQEKMTNIDNIGRMVKGIPCSLGARYINGVVQCAKLTLP